MSTEQTLDGKRILLVITGGIAAYKSLDLIRRVRERGASIRCVLTNAATNFVTPISVGAISGERVFQDIWDRDAEHDIGHIRLARENDLIVVAPASADMLAKMANGLADDLASTVLLATNQDVLVAPAMNPAMWDHRATVRNVDRLRQDGVHFVGPNSGEMAESGEAGTGRMAEPMEIVEAIEKLLDDQPKPLTGLKAVVTAGPTREDIDPVRYISNHSSGKQGYAIAGELAAAGAEVLLVSGPTNLETPVNVTRIDIVSARDMLDAVHKSLPADIAICVAAVADWRVDKQANEKTKKKADSSPPTLSMTENPDILQSIGTSSTNRPDLVVGFAAETDNVIEYARKKLEKKNADWIVANDVSPSTGVFGGDQNKVTVVTAAGAEAWPTISKREVAERLVEKIVARFTSVSV